MSEIKVGDWVEVTRVTGADKFSGIYVGDRFKVVHEVGNTITAKANGKEWLFDKTYVKKIDNPAEERPASDHYQNTNGNDVWQFMDDNLSMERVKGFHQGNALKYITRYSVKHGEPEKRIEDLCKAKVYIDKLIELEKSE